MTAAATPLLEVRGLSSGYGESLVLEGVSFSMGVEAVGILGRNGMGKTTLCDTLMGLIRPSAGEVLLQGERIDGKSPERIARSGISYVPQGRRLFPSLTVDEHLAMLAKGTKGKRWTPKAVYELFPRLADRKASSGGSLSGGEQQMLSVGRALLLNGSLVLMDGVDVLVDAVHHLVSEGTAVLVVEQKLRAATAMAERQLVMVSGHIAAESTATELLADPDLQRRYLGVGSAVDAGEHPLKPQQNRTVS
jgi:branched-chain amino acid transport system ATP-binding protein